MALLTFDQFEAAVPELLAEASGPRGDLHPVGRFGEEGVLKPLSAAIAAAARLVPHIDRPLEPGAHYITPDGEPPRRGDVCAEALAVLAQILEASAAMRSTMSAENARLRGGAGTGAIAEEASLSFAAPGAARRDHRVVARGRAARWRSKRFGGIERTRWIVSACSGWFSAA